jgi:hypothetical protein
LLNGLRHFHGRQNRANRSQSRSRSPACAGCRSRCEQSDDAIDEIKQLLPRFIAFTVNGSHPEAACRKYLFQRTFKFGVGSDAAACWSLPR